MNNNDTFLQLVAADLLKAYGNDLSNITVVFPGQRARLFFDQALGNASEDNVWAPTYTDLNALFASASNLKVADPLTLLMELYRSYSTVGKLQNMKEESFDDFYNFGEILLSDFNDVDSNKVNAMSIFGNLKDLDILKDDFSHLDEKQKEAVNKFLGNAAALEDKTDLQKAFFSIWQILGDVYDSLRKSLKEKGMAYNGMLCRDVVEQPSNNDFISSHFPQKMYVFVGFNVLTKCESELLKSLKKADKARFYWDYDPYIIGANQEAGHFIKKNLETFGGELQEAMKEQRLCNKVQKKTIKIVASPSDSGQAGYIDTWIKVLNKENFDEPDTAIVLCNEQLLQPVASALPSSVNKVNITMGFPLAQTPVFSLVSMLCDLQLKGCAADNKFRYDFVLPLLSHPYVNRILKDCGNIKYKLITAKNFYPAADDLGKSLFFSKAKDVNQFLGLLIEDLKEIAKTFRKQRGATSTAQDDIHRESLFRAFQIITRLKDKLNETKDLTIKMETMGKLLRRMMISTSVPFHGEPACGLQIMGILETRNMDFKNLMMLNVNEDVLPKVSMDSSFMPHFIRQAFGMTTVTHQDSLYAYYFYRLLMRAQNIVLVYSTAEGITNKKEMSRFLWQLLTEYGKTDEIKRIELQFENTLPSQSPFSQEKTTEIINKMIENNKEHSLSPSAFNTYCNCPWHYYLQYVEGIKTPDELTDEMDNSVLGSIFHRTMELIYCTIGTWETDKSSAQNPFDVTQDKLNTCLFNNAITNKVKDLIVKAFGDEYFRRDNVSRNDFNGEQLVYEKIIQEYVRRQLIIDYSYAPFSILALESKEEYTIKLNTGEQIKIGGIVDRIDQKNGIVRIVDYKTGGENKKISDMSKLFDGETADRPHYELQAFIYSYIRIKNGEGNPVKPMLIHVNKANKPDYDPSIIYDKTVVTDFRKQCLDKFEQDFLAKLNELYETNGYFTQTNNESNCKYCDFKRMCGREDKKF